MIKFLHQFTPSAEWLAVLAVLLGPASAFAEAADQFATLEEMVEPNFPPALVMEGIFEGSTRFAIDITETGNVEDWMPLETTHERFIQEIDRVIHRWKFEPAMEDGVPIPCQMTFLIHFNYSDVVQVIGSSNLFFNSLMTKLGGERLVYELADLDRLPRPVNIVRPYRMANDEDGEWTGTVKFQFYIDKEGKVRMPVMTDLEGHRNIALSANEALKEWRFNPPTINGRPVNVRAVQVFHFKPGN